MTGSPAARQGDMTLKGGPITQGSRTVFIGTAGGVACSTCPDGVKVSNPVNPMLGAKVQSGEVDLALPAPMPFIVSRDYSSYQTDTPAPVGLLGPGWQLPLDSSVVQTDVLLTLNDTKGRSIRFEPLQPGQGTYSRSEDLWIVRGGLERLDVEPAFALSKLQLSWQGLPEEDRCNRSMFFAANNPLGPWWIFGSQPPLPDGDVGGQRLHLLGTCNRFGKSLRFARDASGSVTHVQDGAGRQYRLELVKLPTAVNDGAHGWGVDSGVRLVAIHLMRDPMWPQLPVEPLVRYAYSPRGELTAVFGRDGKQLRHFEYHRTLLGRMTAHAHAGRPPVHYVYDVEGKVTELRGQGMLSYRFEYANDSTTVTDSIDRQTIYHFKGKAGLRRVVKVQYPDGSNTQSRFDVSGRQTGTIDALGRETYYRLDVATGNVTEITLPDGLKRKLDYNPHGQIVWAQGSNGASQQMKYDVLGRVHSHIDALGHQIRYGYEDTASEAPNFIEDARGGRKRLTWSPAAQLTSFTDCSGSSTHFQYDRWGQRVAVQAEAGLGEGYQYDPRGLLTIRTNALNQNTSYTYSDAGDITSVTGPDGNRVQLEYNAQGLPTVHHYGGFTQQFAYDDAKRLVTLTNENGAQTSFEYDVMDRLTRQVNFDGRTQSHQFNAAGELIRSDDAGRISHFSYDKGGRLILRQIGDSAHAPQEHFEYNPSGELSKAWHRTELGGNLISTEFVHDQAGRNIGETQSIIGPDGEQVWSYSVQRAFDELGLESRTTYEGLPAIQWQTYGSGHLHGVVLDGQTLIDIERDKLHRETQRTFGALRATRTYDALSRLSLLHAHSPLIGEGKSETFQRQHHYDAAGQLVRIDTPRGPHCYGYDKAGRLISALQPNLPEQHYRFDPAGNRVFENLQFDSAQGQWEETVRQNLQNKYFNVLGDNRAPSSITTDPRWMDNRILSDGDYRYDYDEWGNLRRKYRSQDNEQHHYTYDSDHRLTCYTFESAVASRRANYHYDNFGRRVAKQVQQYDRNGGLVGGIDVTFFGWDGDRLVLNEKDTQQIHTIYEPGSFIPMIRVEGKKSPPKQSLATKLQLRAGMVLDSKTEAIFGEMEEELRRDSLSAFSKQWMQQAGLQAQTLKNLLDPEDSIHEKRVHLYQCDHLGTPLMLVSRQGKCDWEITLGAWGCAQHEISPDNLKQPIRYQGQYLDNESSTHYNRYRYYHPHTAQYTTQDPIGLFGGLNFSNYAAGNSIKNIDPLGLAELNAIPADQKALHDAANKINFPNYFTVVVHGSPQSVSPTGISGADQEWTPEMLAKIIQDYPQYKKGKRIFLLSCNTGQGENSFAQQLSNILKAPVLAPNELAWVNTSKGTVEVFGQTSTGELDLSKPGKFIKFRPKK